MVGLALRWSVTFLLLGLVLFWIEPEALLSQFRHLHIGWLLLALLTGGLQILLSAWRWRFTARQLGLQLSAPRAVADYFLSTLVNQVVPGGVLGDVARGLRHGGRLGQGEPAGRYGIAVRAVMLERLSGQLVLLPVLLLLLLVTITGQQLMTALWTRTGWPLTLTVLSGIAVMGLLLRSGHLPWPQPLLALARTVRSEVRRALLRWPVCGWQLLSSLAVVTSYLLLFVFSARALGIATPVQTLLPLIPLVLLGMLVPFTVSGWGVREGVAALVWPLAGLPAEQGVAISVLYGILVLLSSLPGLLTLAFDTGAQSRARSNSVSRPRSKRRKSGRKASSS